MSFLDQIIIKVSPDAFKKSVTGIRVNGRLGNNPAVWARAELGEEVEDTAYHPNSTTDYRKFLNCKVEFAISFENLKAGRIIKGASICRTIWIFAE